MDKTPSWGIEPVPERLRVLGVVDQTTWRALGLRGSVPRPVPID